MNRLRVDIEIRQTRTAQKSRNAVCKNIAIIDQGIVEHTIRLLNIETFILDVETDASEIVLEGIECRYQDGELEIDVPKEAGLNPVFAQLSEQDVQVLSMRNKANRLEELFVRLVEAGRGDNHE